MFAHRTISRASVRSVDGKHAFDFNTDIERQGCNPDCSARVCAFVAQYFADEIRCAVDHFGMLTEIWG